MSFEILKHFYVVTAFQLFFFGLVVLSMRPLKKHQYWLAAFLFLEFLSLFLISGHYHYQFIPNNRLYLLLSFISEYSICPVFYLFVTSISMQSTHLKPKHILLAIPFLIGFTFLYIPEKLWAQHAYTFHLTLTVNYYGQAIFYSIMAWKHYRLFQQKMNNYATQDFIERLSWLKLAIIAYTAIWLIAFTHNILNMFNYGFNAIANYIIEVVSLLFLNALMFIGVRKPIDVNQIPATEFTHNTQSNSAKYAASSLSNSDKEKILDKLKAKMETDLLYKTPNLTLKVLADKLDVQTKHLSQIINEHYDTNFCEYINSLRIEDAKLQLANPKYTYKTILEIIYDTGFNSKSVFNTVFKKQTGITPSAYRKNCK